MLRIENFSKSYGDDKVIVDNLSLSIEAGDIYGFIGLNGAGKTTTIKAIVGIHDFEKGNIFIDGHSIKTNPLECKKVMAYIPDNPDIYEHLTGYQYINFIADLYEVDTKLREERIQKYGDMFGITPRLTDVISDYSHGMRQQVSLIAALVHSPKLLILDEPFVGLDPKAAFNLKNLMKEIVDNGGAIFFSTHVLEVAEKICNKVAIIKKGKLIISGKTDEVRGDASLEEIFLEVSSNE